MTTGLRYNEDNTILLIEEVGKEIDTNSDFGDWGSLRPIAQQTDRLLRKHFRWKRQAIVYPGEIQSR